jgi:hypothetical protein
VSDLRAGSTSRRSVGLRRFSEFTGREASGYWGKAQFSAPAAERAQIAHEVTAHPTSYGLTNKALGLSWQALLRRVRTDAAVLLQHPEVSSPEEAASASSQRRGGIDLVDRTLKGHTGIMSRDRDPEQRRWLSLGYGGSKASSSTWRYWKKAGVRGVWIIAAPNDLARFEQRDCDVFYEGDRVVSATTQWDATWQTLAYFYGHLIRKTPAPPLG